MCGMTVLDVRRNAVWFVTGLARVANLGRQVLHPQREFNMSSNFEERKLHVPCKIRFCII
jgi:hypothetical protein